MGSILFPLGAGVAFYPMAVLAAGIGVLRGGGLPPSHSLKAMTYRSFIAWAGGRQLGILGEQGRQVRTTHSFERFLFFLIWYCEMGRSLTNMFEMEMDIVEL
jgi:hypothetical protein